MSFNPDAGSISGATDAALSNPTQSQRLSYDEGTGKWINETTTIGVVTGLQTALDAKLNKKNDTVELTDSLNDKFAQINITDDASPTAEWTDRLAFYFDGTRTGYFNEYGEIRSRAAKSSTVAMRAMGHVGSSDTNDIFQVATSTGDPLLGVSKQYLTSNDLVRNDTYTAIPSGGEYLERTTIDYPLLSSNPEVSQVWVDGDKSSWLNEWGALRGHNPYSSWGDALARAIIMPGDYVGSNAFEIVDRRNGPPNTITWGRSWVDGSLNRNGNTMADVYVMSNGGTPPSTLPAGTVIIELDA